MPPTSASHFGWLDWLVLGAYFALLVITGIWLSRRQRGTEDYFLAGRSMPAWAVAVSVLATSLSAATFLGGPQQAYDGDLTYLFATVGTIVAALVAAAWFIPAYYRHGVTTVYELLELRFGPAASLAASWMFMIGRVMASGARVYIAAHALAFIAWGDLSPGSLIAGIAILSAAGVLYTIVGGIATVIWTDVVQTIVMMIAILAALILLIWRIPAPMGEIVAALRDADKLQILDFSTDPGASFTVWTSLTGFALLNLAALATDQDLAQRMLTCRSSVKAAWSVIASQLMAIPVVLVFMLIGALLFVTHQQPELAGSAGLAPAPADSRGVFLDFIVGGLPAGLSGLMIAGLFAVGLSSLDSALNAMSSTFVNDFYKRVRPGRTDRHYLAIGRAGVAAWGIALGAFAVFCVFWQRSTPDESLLEFALRVMVFAYAGLLAVFTCAVFTRRGSAFSAIAALATGFVVTLLLEPAVWALLPLPSRLSELKLAFPWRMTIATLIAFGVSVLGGRSSRSMALRSAISPPVRQNHGDVEKADDSVAVGVA